jgi:hypothetical protein
MRLRVGQPQPRCRELAFPVLVDVLHSPLRCAVIHVLSTLHSCFVHPPTRSHFPCCPLVIHPSDAMASVIPVVDCVFSLQNPVPQSHLLSSMSFQLAGKSLGLFLLVLEERVYFPSMIGTSVSIFTYLLPLLSSLGCARTIKACA